MNSKRILALYLPGRNLELTKDAGMIPFMLYKYFNYDATFACYRNGEYPSLNNEVAGMNIVFVNKIFNNIFLDSIFFILFNFRKYDVLYMIHRPFALCGIIFKILKLGNGCTYIKLDADDKIQLNRSNLKTKVLEAALLKNDIISIETKKLQEFFKSKSRLNIQYIPNGFYDFGKREKIKYEEKENVILTVGRIGTEQKGTEILLEGFRLFAKKNRKWKLKIVGPIEPAFNAYINLFFEENPSLVGLIEFVGPIFDRKALQKIYRSSKIFVLSSRYESFGFVYVEALQAGCYIVSTSITPAYDITDNEKYGILFPIDDSNMLANCLETATYSDEFLRVNCQKAQDFAYDNFYWPKIVGKINLLIENKIYSN